MGKFLFLWDFAYLWLWNFVMSMIFYIYAFFNCKIICFFYSFFLLNDSDPVKRKPEKHKLDIILEAPCQLEMVETSTYFFFASWFLIIQYLSKSQLSNLTTIILVLFHKRNLEEWMAMLKQGRDNPLKPMSKVL